jgi:hypothetical protein
MQSSCVQTLSLVFPFFSGENLRIFTRRKIDKTREVTNVLCCRVVLHHPRRFFKQT